MNLPCRWRGLWSIMNRWSENKWITNYQYSHFTFHFKWMLAGVKEKCDFRRDVTAKSTSDVGYWQRAWECWKNCTYVAFTKPEILRFATISPPWTVQGSGPYWKKWHILYWSKPRSNPVNGHKHQLCSRVNAWWCASKRAVLLPVRHRASNQCMFPGHSESREDRRS